MKTILLVLLLLPAAIGAHAFALTQAELTGQLGQLELRTSVLEEKIKQVEGGSTQWDKRGLLEEWSIVNGEVLRIEGDLAALAPAAAACTYTYSTWSPASCPSNGTQTRTVTATTPAACTGTPVLSQSCTYVPPACTYTYSDWSSCQQNGIKMHTVTASVPTGCTGTPSLSQSCTYVAATNPNAGDASRLGVSAPGDNTVSVALNTGGGNPGARGVVNTGGGGTPQGGTNSGGAVTGGDASGLGARSDGFGATGSMGERDSDTVNDTDVSSRTVTGLLKRIGGIFNSLVPFIIGLTVFVVIWKIFVYITHAADEEKRAEARAFIIWGIVGVFFMLSIWGFVNLLINTFDIRNDIQPGAIPTVPRLNTSP